MRDFASECRRCPTCCTFSRNPTWPRLSANTDPIPGDAICLCRDADLRELVALVNAAYRGAGGSVGWTNEIGLVDGERVTLESLRREMVATPAACIYLLRDADGLLACVRVDDAWSHGEPVCYISMLAVRPDRQDAGVGRRMLEFAETQGQAQGARAARMSVVSIRTSLIAWYERRGYRRTGETEPFPYDDAHFGQPQRRGLEFILLQKELA
jgi:ribosomal protein S18 acetylase RimI-like enzyme